jgi:Na+-driven multidrug efflux pump
LFISGILIFLGYAFMVFPYTISVGFLTNYSDQENLNAYGIGYIMISLMLTFYYGINCGMETQTSQLVGAKYY